jgi:hypothetical protein
MAKNMAKNVEEPDYVVEDELHSVMKFDRGQKLEEILPYIKAERLSGTLCVDINIGGINNIRFNQKRPVDVIYDKDEKA